ncbi:MAG: phage tail length tape measure family protein, partial [Dokdonella sp.]
MAAASAVNVEATKGGEDEPKRADRHRRHVRLDTRLVNCRQRDGHRRRRIAGRSRASESIRSRQGAAACVSSGTRKRRRRSAAELHRSFARAAQRGHSQGSESMTDTTTGITFFFKDQASGPAKQARDGIKAVGDASDTTAAKIDNVSSATAALGSTSQKAAQSIQSLAAGHGAIAENAARAALAITSVSGVLGLGAAAALLYVGAYAKGASQIDSFNRSLTATGNFAGFTALGLSHLTSEIGAQTGAYRDAEQALNKLASGGKLAGDGLANAARSAVSLSQITGESIDKTVGEFEKLADKPVKAALELNASYHFLTLAVYDQIKALQDQGKEQEATDLILDTSAKVFEDRRQK